MPVRLLILVTALAVIMAASPALARRALHHHSKRPAPTQQSEKIKPPDVQRHPDDVALDRKIKGICRGC
jgi:hypothetical protein